MRKIKRYITYISKFAKSEGKKIIVKDFLVEIKSKGLHIGTKSFLHKRYMKDLYGADLQHIVHILASRLFDHEYYLNTYPDIKNDGIDPLFHYYYYGWREGRNPNVEFDTKYYVSKYKVNYNPLYHYLTIGQMANYQISSEDHSKNIFNIKKILDTLIQPSNNHQDIIVLITHDMSRSGAPLLLLNIARELNEQHNKKIILISVMDGELYLDFEQFCHVVCLKQANLNFLESSDQVDTLFYSLFDYSISNVLANTVGSCLFIPVLEKYGFNYYILVHELFGVINRMNWTDMVKRNLPLITNGKLIYSSQYVLDSHLQTFQLPPNIDLIPQGMFHSIQRKVNATSKLKLRQQYGIPNDAKVVFTGGRDLIRKGIDLFFNLALNVTAKYDGIYFLCLCDKDSPELLALLGDNFKCHNKIIFDDFAVNYSLYLEGCDVFALTSREDPFPNVMLDSLAHGLPMIAFADCGGAPELLKKIHEILVAKKLDIEDFANNLTQLLNDKDLYQSISNKSLEIIKDYKFDKYVSKLEKLMVKQKFQPYIVKPSSKSITKRVMHVIGNFNVGGSSQLVIDLIERLSTYQHFVVTQFIPHPQAYIGMDMFQVAAENIADLAIIINKIKPTLIHVHYWGRGDNSWYELLYANLKNFNIPTIQNINVSVTPLVNNLNCAYVYVSEFVKKTHGISNVLESVIYPGSDFKLFSSRDLNESINCDFVGMVYRLDSDKVNEKSIDPFIELCKINSEVKCLIVGDGELLSIYKAKVLAAGFCERFVFTGYVSYTALPELYRKMRIFMAPVFDESFGQVTPFAMHIGMPVVGYDTGAIGEIIANNNLLAPPGAAEQLAQICNQIWHDKGKALEISQVNINRAKDNFSIESMIASYQQLYDKYNPPCSNRILFIALNPNAQEGGGADVLWVEAVNNLAVNGLKPGLVVFSRNNLTAKVGGLLSGAKVYYSSESGLYALSDYKPDLVVMIQGDHNEGVEWFKECSQNNIPYVIVNQLTKEGFWPDDTAANSIRNGYKNAHKVFFTCKNNQLLMERQLGCKLTNAGRHCNPVTGIERELILPFPAVINDEYHLACPARLLIIHKGQDLLFEVLRQEKWKHRKLIINLYGDGPNKRQLKQLKLYYQVENINFCDYAYDVKDIWRKNHGIIMPSHMEGVPIVLLGAMFCARVPILTDVGGHRELVEDNFSGFIAKSPTAELLDEALERAWAQRLNWEAIGAASRHFVLKFQVENPVQDFIEKVLL